MTPSRWTSAGSWLAVAVTFNVAVVAVIYMLYPGYIDHGEAAISAMAWKMLAGNPVYHSFDSADRVTNLYGPFVFLWHSWPLALLGGSVATSKLAATVAAILIPVISWAIADRRHPLAGWVVAFAGIMIIVHLNAPVVVRPDALLACIAALIVLIARHSAPQQGWGMAIAVGLVAGIAVNIKIHAAIYIAPVALYLLWTDWRRLPPMAAAALAAAFFPFVLPIFPLADYLAWFGPMAAKENVWMGFTLLWWKLLLYFLPVLLLALGGRSAWAVCDVRTRLYFAGYAAALLAVLFPATKFGGGDQYYLPFLPLTVDLCIRALTLGETSSRQRTALVLTVLIALGASYQPERRFFKKLEWDLSRQVVAEIESILRDYPDRRIQMGTGRVPEERGDQLSFHFYSWRNLPVYQGHPFTIDAGIMMELTKLGVPFPDESLRRLATCHTQIWLVPRGGRPFELQGYYLQQVFSDEVRETFARHHYKLESRAIFDLWACRD